MKPHRVIVCAAGVLVTGHLAGCSAILGISDLPPATGDDAGTSSASNGSSMGTGVGGPGGGAIGIGSMSGGSMSGGSTSGGSTSGGSTSGGSMAGDASGSSASSSGVSCNPNASTLECNTCITGSCCDSFAACDDDPNCSGAFNCVASSTSSTSVDEFCACLSSYGGYRTVVNASFTACYGQNCTGACDVVSTLPIGAECSPTEGCFLEPCVQSSTGVDTCFQFCCGDTDCPSGETCVQAVDVAGDYTQVCSG